LGYHPDVILSGRRINDDMGRYIANSVVKLMVKNDLKVKASKVLVLGITFKENCSDIRNSRIIDLVTELQDYGVLVDVYDPFANKVEVLKEYGIPLKEDLGDRYEGIVIAVAHDGFLEIDLPSLKSGPQTVVYDIKSLFPKGAVTARL
jgi:UDP-N-acetyl-D-galactosamine dehydrogenase